jgi:NitT/TauT family transport system ATP-binding protein
VLSIRLLTVEDESPEEIYSEIHAELSSWLFVKKGLVALEQPASGDHAWVTNLADWRTVVEQVSARHHLTFCTVDLRIPEGAADGIPDVRHGLTLLRELQERADAGVRGCVLTGLAGHELEALVRQGVIPEVLFDFKGDQTGYPNIVNYIRTQALSLIDTLRFPGADGEPRVVVLDDDSGDLRDHFLSKASYFIDPGTWHVPILMIGEDGLGSRTLLEFVAYLAEASFSTIDLRTDSWKGNRKNLRLLESLLETVRDGQGSGRQLVYVKGLDEYQPGISAEEGESCLQPLKRLLALLEECEPGRCSVAIAFSISGESRLRIRSAEARTFIRGLEEGIGRLTGFPLQHLSMNENGWTTGHPRILHTPSLQARGGEFLRRSVEVQLALMAEAATRRIVGYRGEPVTLAGDVLDLMVDKTDWSQYGNLAAFGRVLQAAFENFVRDRALGQYEITRAHLDDEVKAWLHRVVLNMDDVRLAFESNRGSPLQVIERADFQVEEGELLVILGPSGSGKSTILRLFAGLLKPTEGKVTYRGHEIDGPSEKVGMVFQDYSLFPWLTVRENVAFGPRRRRENGEAHGPRVEDLLEISKLTGFEDAYPRQLSGGMRQRVAIVRALANDPDVLLMDEPFGALDLQTRWQMQDFLLATKQLTKKTIVFVTHDIDEAVFVGDRIYIASPRPLRLGKCFAVPFSAAVRHAGLRRDSSFGSLVNRVREALLEAASKAP